MGFIKLKMVEKLGNKHYLWISMSGIIDVQHAPNNYNIMFAVVMDKR